MSSERDLDVEFSDTNGTQRETTPSKHKVINLILRKLFDAKEEETIEYHIDVDTAKDVIQELDRRKENNSLRLSYNSKRQTLRLVLTPSFIHDSHQPWLNNAIRNWTLAGLLLPQQADDLRVLSGTRFESFGVPYTSSRKEPDQCVTPRGLPLPTLVVESGWSESRPVLHNDRDLWLVGGSGMVQVVIVLKWSKTAQRHVKGDLEVFDLDAFGNVRTLQQEIIFPRPPPMAAAMQFVNVTASQLFGPALPAGQNPATIFALSVDSLRDIADEYIRRQGFVPA